MAAPVMSPQPVKTESSPIMDVMAIAVSKATTRGGIVGSTRRVANSRSTKKGATTTRSAHGEKSPGVGRTTATTPMNPRAINP